MQSAKRKHFQKVSVLTKKERKKETEFWSNFELCYKEWNRIQVYVGFAFDVERRGPSTRSCGMVPTAHCRHGVENQCFRFRALLTYVMIGPALQSAHKFFCDVCPTLPMVGGTSGTT